MNTYWDTLMWETEVSLEEKEIRVSIEGQISEIDDQVLRKLQDKDIVVDNVKLVPTDESKNARRTSGKNCR